MFFYRPRSRHRSPPIDLTELEAAFRSWLEDPAKPDVVRLGSPPDTALPTAELLRRLRGSRAELRAPHCEQVGLPPGASVAGAAAALLRATIDPDGPRCRSFRAASYYLRGLSRLEQDGPPPDGSSRLGAHRTSSRPRLGVG